MGDSQCGAPYAESGGTVLPGPVPALWTGLPYHRGMPRGGVELWEAVAARGPAIGPGEGAIWQCGIRGAAATNIARDAGIVTFIRETSNVELIRSIL